MEQMIKNAVTASCGIKETLLSEESLGLIRRIAGSMIKALREGGKIIVFGNGGSAADSQHMAAELVGRFKKERRGIPAIALTVNTSTITALSNDYAYEVCFKRQLEALGKKGDVAVGISTSGRAKNVIEALREAKKMGLVTVALTGKDGGEVKGVADIPFVVKSDETPRIQEAHILIIHILCELIENAQDKNG